MNPAILIGVFCMIALAAANVVTYDGMVGVARSIALEKKSLDDARGTNVELKKRWYQALDQDNLKALVKEYGFVRVSSPGYLPS